MKHVALVNMPWSSIRRPSIALGVLKRVLRRHLITARILYLNIRLASQMDLAQYERISETSLVGDWLFSQLLFGRYGTGELKNSYEDLAADSLGMGERTIAAKALIDHQKLDAKALCENTLQPFIDRCVSEISWQDYAVVGFTSVFAQNTASLLLASRIKERFPQIKIVFGGANVEGPMGKALLRAFDWIDYVVDGEAEEAFPVLVKNILYERDGEPIPGVSLRRNNCVIMDSSSTRSMVNINRVPIPDYTEYFQELETAGLNDKVSSLLLFQTARGCWWGEKSHCNFCGLNGQIMKFRSRSPRRVLRELRYQSRKYRFSFFESVDNILDMQYFSTLIPMLKEDPLPGNFYFEVKANIKEHHLDMLKSAGITMIQPGIESFQTDVLKLMRKGVTGIHNIQLLKGARSREMRIMWNLIYGFPGEAPEHYDELSCTIPLLTHLEPPSSVGRIDLQRFSPYYYDAEKFGIANIRPMPLYYYIYPERRVNLHNLAYHFDYSLSTPDSHLLPGVRSLRNAVTEWKRAHYVHKARFEYHREADIVTLFDTRSNVNGGAQHTLRGLPAALYDYCNTVRPIKEVVQYAAEINGGKEHEDPVHDTLNDFVQRGWMFNEGQRYLALAVRTSEASRPPHQ